MRRALAAVWVLAALLLLAGLPSMSADAAAPTCTGAWVLVGQDLRCATSHATGEQALESAGFPLARSGGMICRIGEVPKDCVITAEAYWSYWQAKRLPDGSYGPWTYATVGAASSAPGAGDAEGWVFGNGRTPPGALPPAGSAPTPPLASAAATPTARPSDTDEDDGRVGSAAGTWIALGTLAVVAAGVRVAATRRKDSR